MSYIVILITVVNEKEGNIIAKALILNKLAACVNIVPQIKSIYWWKGKIETSTEKLLIVKTKKTLIPKLIKVVKKLHSYTVPEIIALPIIAGNKDYLEWIYDSTK